LVSHGNTLRRANNGTQAAIHALGHIDIKLSGIQSFGGAVRRLPNGLRRFYRLNINAGYRAYLGAKVAYDAVIHLHIQLVAAYFGDRQLLMRILDGIGALHLLKVIVAAGGQYLPLLMRRKEMLPGEGHAFKGRFYGVVH